LPRIFASKLALFPLASVPDERHAPIQSSTRPLDHLNGAGLLWRISGGKITAMQSDWATIEINGVQHIVHRRPALLSVRHSHGAFGRARAIRYPSGRPENPRQSFRS
jgi:hypothetical protein